MTTHTFSLCHPEAALWPKDPYVHYVVSVQPAGTAINLIEGHNRAPQTAT